MSKKLYQAYKNEVIAHTETQETAFRRLIQIRFLLLEKHQLEKELSKERQQVKELMHSI